MITLRPYQVEIVDQVRDAFRAGKRRVLVVSPTGSGKTAIFAHIASGVASRGKRIVTLSHRDFLHDQICSALTLAGVQHGILKGGTKYTTKQQVVVASIFTLAKRVEHFSAPDLIIADEAHHCLAGSWEKVANAFPKAWILGVTATPVRQAGEGLGDFFDHMIEGPSVAELTATGFLSPAVVYAPKKAPDLRGLRTRGGDYISAEVDAIMDKPAITGDAVEHYERITPGKSAVAFCCSIRHAEDVAEMFRRSGHAAKAVHGRMEKWEIKKTFEDFGSGKIKIVTAADLISEGLDIPGIECCILLRPTKSLGLYLQQVGRSIRIAPGKQRTVILDHAANVALHGLPDEFRNWTLEKSVDKKMKAQVPTVRTCPKCFAMHRPQPKCPVCGHEYEVSGRMVDHVDGELEQVSGGTEADYLVDLERRFHILRKVGERCKLVDPSQWALSVVAAELARRRAPKEGEPSVNGVSVDDYDELKGRVERAMANERERNEAARKQQEMPV